MALTVMHTTVGQAWVARPNRSLAQNQARRLIFAVAGVTGIIAFVFACFGAWPVIPFAGVEVAVLWLALRHLQHHADDEERLDVNESFITVTRFVCGRQEVHQFPRYWVQLRIENEDVLGAGKGGCRLFLRSHGREQEVGRLLTEEQKRALVESLRKQLGNSVQQNNEAEP